MRRALREGESPTTPSLIEEAKAVLPRLLEVAQHPAGPEGVARVIAPRFALYPQPQRTEKEWAAWWLPYQDALADLPEEAIEAAMAEWVRAPDSEFLPKPGKLRQLAIRAQTPAATAYARARKIADTPPPPTRAEKAEVEAMLAEVTGILSKKAN